MTIPNVIIHLRYSYPRYINMLVQLTLGLVNAFGAFNPVSTAGYLSRNWGIEPQIIGIALIVSGIASGLSVGRRLYFASCVVFGLYVGVTLLAGLRGELPFQPAIYGSGMLAYMVLTGWWGIRYGE